MILQQPWEAWHGAQLAANEKARTGPELGEEEGQRELRGPSVVLPLLLPRQGCRKQQEEQVMERASLCVGRFQNLGENRCFAQLSQARKIGPAPAPRGLGRGHRGYNSVGTLDQAGPAGSLRAEASFSA